MNAVVQGRGAIYYSVSYKNIEKDLRNLSGAPPPPFPQYNCVSMKIFLVTKILILYNVMLC